MAKAKAGAVKLVGKIDKRVFVDSRIQGYHSREYTEPSPLNNSQVFNHNKQRTALLNEMASVLNKIVEHYCGRFKSQHFYKNVKKRLWNEELDNRFLLLRQLKGLEAHPTYPFMNLGACRTTVTATKNKITIDLVTTVHPLKGKYDADHYYYEVILLLWNKNSNNYEAQHSRQRSDRISLEYGSELPEFEFHFAKPAATAHWLLCLRQQLLVGEKKVEAFEGEAMQIVEAGTFDKKDEELLVKRKEEEEKEAARRRNKEKKEEEIVVVRAKRKNDRSA